MAAAARQLHQRIFNTSYEAADGEVPVWHPTVRFYRVYKDSQLAAHLYFDPYARPGACTPLHMPVAGLLTQEASQTHSSVCRLSSKLAAKRSTPHKERSGDFASIAWSSLRFESSCMSMLGMPALALVCTSVTKRREL